MKGNTALGSVYISIQSERLDFSFLSVLCFAFAMFSLIGQTYLTDDVNASNHVQTSVGCNTGELELSISGHKGQSHQHILTLKGVSAYCVKSVPKECCVILLLECKEPFS